MTSGLQWGDSKTLEKADPYLAWADETDYASYRLSKVPDAGEDDWWLVLLELARDVEGKKSPLARLLAALSGGDWLQVPTVYADLDARGVGFCYCTARVKRKFFQEVLKGGVLEEIVTRYKLCSPVEYPVKGLKTVGVDARPPLAGSNGGPVIALIDGGVALGHSAFLQSDQKNPRVAHFWRQDDYLGSRYLRDTVRTNTLWPNTHSHWQDSRTMGYGAELDRKAIAEAMQASQYLGMLDEDALYQRLGLWDLDRLAHHGTHVLSLAAGPYRHPEQMGTEASPPEWGTPSNGDLKSSEDCDLVAVQLAWANVLDTSGRCGDAHILDALMYVWARCDDAANVVVNLSWGVNAGPHDGSSILEKAMVDWCALRPEKLSIVVPAGNSYQARGHANVKLEKQDASVELNWRIQPECYTPSFLEIWFDPEISDAVGVSVHVTPPDSRNGFDLTAPGVVKWSVRGKPSATLVMLKRPNLSEKGSMALVAVEPTAGDGPGALAPAGVWKVKVTNKGTSSIGLCTYIERNDVAMGLFTGAKQSYFEDEKYNLGDAVDDDVQRAVLRLNPVNGSDVRRTGTFNHLSTGANGQNNVHSVGGLVVFPTGREPKDIMPSPYSPRWDDGKDKRVSGRRKSPTTMMPSDQSLVLPGLRAAASRSGAVVRLVGTSSAVPLAVRALVKKGKLDTGPGSQVGEDK